MHRPIVYDITHLQRCLLSKALSGIGRVDLLFGRHFSARDISACVRYGRIYPKVVPSSELGEIVHRADIQWREQSSTDGDEEFFYTFQWIRGKNKGRRVLDKDYGRGRKAVDGVKRLFQTTYSLMSRRRPVPEGAIYLNMAQHATENASWFNWLSARKDVRSVFFLYDLIPLDFPEYWWDGHKDLFSRRVDTIFRHASALVTSSAAVRDRVVEEMCARNTAKIPIYCAHLPSPTEIVLNRSHKDVTLKSESYFVVLGTIEPRKNHSLLLNVWRRLVVRGGFVPKLIIIGNRGWENENVVDMLDRSPLISNYVWEVAGLSNAGISKLLANARALLMPSFAEGYGLPLVEALSVGTPVIASDIPVFHEVTQGRAIFRDPIDGLGWSEAIMALADVQSQESRAAREEARRFRPMTSDVYFEGLEAFLSTL
jgi:glycosyltransferase involved in cell wall biosynthesis